MKTNTMYLFSMILIAALLFFPDVDGVLQVTAFSCNDQSGTVVVDTLAGLSCQATVNNPDTETATLNSVVLYPDGNWMESSSYSGSGFDTSISAGASTVASFTGLTPTVAGVNEFDYINIDGVIDTFITDTTMNVLDIKTISLSPSIGSGNQNDEFDLQSTVTAGGDLDSVTVEVSPSNCNLKSGESSSVSLGDLSHNSQGSQSWKILMGNDHCSYTVTASGTTGGITTSDSASGSVTNLNPVTTTTLRSGVGGGGGGGGGEGGAGEAKPQEPEKFAVDFSQPGVQEFVTKVNEGGQLKFSFDGSTPHVLQLDKVLADSVIVTVQSNPVTFTLFIGESRNVDFNQDGQDDMSVTLVSIFGKSATIQMQKLEGAVVLAEEEKKAAAEKSGLSGLLPSAVTPEGEVGRWGMILWGGIILIVLIIGIEIYLKRKHGSQRKYDSRRKKREPWD